MPSEAMLIDPEKEKDNPNKHKKGLIDGDIDLRQHTEAFVEAKMEEVKMKKSYHHACTGCHDPDS